MISRSTVFFSSRTFPFQRALCMYSSAPGVKRGGRRLLSRLKRSAKCRTSAGTSEASPDQPAASLRCATRCHGSNEGVPTANKPPGRCGGGHSV